MFLFLRVTSRRRHSSLPRVPWRTPAEIFGRWLFRETVALSSCCVKQRRMERYQWYDFSHSFFLNTNLDKRQLTIEFIYWFLMAGNLCSVLALWWWWYSLWWIFCPSSRWSEIPWVCWKDTVNCREGNTAKSGDLAVQQFLVYEVLLVYWYFLVNNPYHWFGIVMWCCSMYTVTHTHIVLVFRTTILFPQMWCVCVRTHLIRSWSRFNASLLLVKLLPD